MIWSYGAKTEPNSYVITKAHLMMNIQCQHQTLPQAVYEKYKFSHYRKYEQ